MRHKMKSPKITIDIIINYKGGIVLIKRKNPPIGWALPGGFVDYGETLESAAKREAKEETNLALKNLRQFHVYSEPKRDPRGHTISVVFIAEGYGTLKAKTDAKGIKAFNKNNIPKMVFDHNKILEDYLRGTYS